jgi:protein TonB
MSPHVDILEQPEHLGKSFVGSIVFHGGLVLLAVGVTFVQHRNDFKLGDTKGGGGLGGAVVVKPTDIRLPNPGGPTNPVANDTASQVPTPPAMKAPPKAEKAPSPNAIPIPSKNAPKTPAKPSWYHPELANDKFRQKEKFGPNQVYASPGRQLSSPDQNLPSGVGLGGSSAPFGSQFGAYATIIQNKVASVWKKPVNAGVSGVPRCTISFTLHRDGSVSDVKISQRSSVSQLDFSGQRAIMDAAPFPSFPAGLNKTEVGIDFVFELSR